MTEKQRRFIDYYIQTGNASEAARKAGYSKRSDYSTGERLLRKADISAGIKARLKELESQRVAETQEVLEHLTAVLRGKVEETIVTPSGKKFILPVRESDRLRAAENLLKIFGAYKDKVDVKVSGAELFVETLTRIQEKVDRNVGADAMETAR